ncbi:MAG: type III pantothenate kinase [Peptococcaceae bacterium]|nr:type III pantothenate kinase [Peptococcaceae bacterium]
MVLAVDVGNTNIVIGLFSGSNLTGVFRLSTDIRKTAQEYSVLIKKLVPQWRELDGISISSVVPPLNGVLYQVCREYLNLEPLFIDCRSDLGISLEVDFPNEIGTDRLVNAAAAFNLYGGPVIIADLGTSTTCCAVSSGGCFLGGVILPGIGISMEALFESTSKLPRVELARPLEVIGKNTAHSLQAGIYFGYVGMVDKIIGEFIHELGQDSTVVATGGFADIVFQESAYTSQIVPNLTLEGLRFLYLRNKNLPRKTLVG